MLSLLSSAPSRAQAPADSITLIRTPDGAEHYVLPRRAALHYRQVVLELVPALEARVVELETALGVETELSANRLRQIETLSQTREAMQAQVSSLSTDLDDLRAQFERVDAARKRERFWKRFWKGSSLAAAGVAVALGIVVLAD